MSSYSSQNLLKAFISVYQSPYNHLMSICRATPSFGPHASYFLLYSALASLALLLKHNKYSPSSSGYTHFTPPDVYICEAFPGY